jgi:hypothetical protein
MTPHALLVAGRARVSGSRDLAVSNGVSCEAAEVREANLTPVTSIYWPATKCLAPISLPGINEGEVVSVLVHTLAAVPTGSNASCVTGNSFSTRLGATPAAWK